MNVVPFIDIMLVLLVIVLTTASFIAKGIIPVDLSTSKATLSIKKEDSLIITITKDNELFLNKIRVQKDNFLQKLLDFKSSNGVIINCDKNVFFKEFIFVIDILKNNSYNNLSIVTKNE